MAQVAALLAMPIVAPTVARVTVLHRLGMFLSHTVCSYLFQPLPLWSVCSLCLLHWHRSINVRTGCCTWGKTVCSVCTCPIAMYSLARDPNMTVAAYMYLYAYVYVHIYRCVCIFMYMCNICMYVCMHACMCVCVCVWVGGWLCVYEYPCVQWMRLSYECLYLHLSLWTRLPSCFLARCLCMFGLLVRAAPRLWPLLVWMRLGVCVSNARANCTAKAKQ